ncbi:MAG: DUF1800 domain-containing protein [Ignavibacteria bacterium]|nr:DUF1800 domain-containing protein [Ignavibacteria bacterium]
METSKTGLLDPYIPSPTKPWNKTLVTHLLNRTMFGATVSQVNSVLALTPNEAVELLFQPYAAPEVPGTWVTEAPDFNSAYNTQRTSQLRTWWVRLMYEQPVSIREKMTLFWHNHFVSEAATVIIPQYMYMQNTLFRNNCTGNFRTLAKLVTRDPGMLIYLDGRYNIVGNPNENYGRELLELFTMGIGNYTETDVREAARALTGWILSGLGSIFVPSRHDYGNKTFLGQTGNFDDNDVIDIIFNQPVTAKFICTKLYKTFIHQNDDLSYAQPVIDEMANILRSNNYEIAPLLKTLLKSKLFYSDNTISSLIKNPLDLMIGSVKMLNINFDPSSLTTRLNYIITQASAAGQYILDPPNVQGWVGYRQWLSTISMPIRAAFAESIITGLQKNGQPTGFSVDALAFAMSFSAPNNAVQLVKDMTEHLLRLTVTPRQLNALLEIMLDGSLVMDWYINDPQAPSRIKKYLKALVNLAEFQIN